MSMIPRERAESVVVAGNSKLKAETGHGEIVHFPDDAVNHVVPAGHNRRQPIRVHDEASASETGRADEDRVRAALPDHRWSIIS